MNSNYTMVGLLKNSKTDVRGVWVWGWGAGSCLRLRTKADFKVICGVVRIRAAKERFK